REAPQGEALEGRGTGSSGGSTGPSRRYVPGGLHGAIRMRCLCAACFSEEVAERNQDRSDGRGLGSSATEDGTRGLRDALWQTEEVSARWFAVRAMFFEIWG